MGIKCDKLKKQSFEEELKKCENKYNFTKLYPVGKGGFGRVN